MSKNLLLVILSLGICRTSSAQWSQINMEVGRWYHSSVIVEGKLIIAGGLIDGFQPINSVEIYDIETGTWTDTTLSEARAFMSTAVHGSKVYFAGGGDLSGGVSGQIDIYDATTGEWSMMNLLEPRAALSAATVGDQLIFAGGGTINYPSFSPSSTVEIYNTTVGEWEYPILSEARMIMTVAVAGNKAFFAGGIKNDKAASNRIDIYDAGASSNTWTTATLSQPRHFLSATTLRDKVLFAGGADPMSNDYDVIDIYDLNTLDWAPPVALPIEASAIAAATMGNKAYFAGGSTVDDNLFVEDPSNAVYIYDTYHDLQGWGVEHMQTPRTGASAVVWENQLFISGGFNWIDRHLNSIEIYTDTTLVNAVEAPALILDIPLYPNPNKGQFTIELPQGLHLPATIRLLNLRSQEVFRKSANAHSQSIDVRHLPNGVYFLSAYGAEGRLVAKRKVVIAH